MQDKINQNEDFSKFVMFSHEAKFCNNGTEVLKNKVYETPFQHTDTLKNRIRAACREITFEILTRVRHSFITRAQAYLQNEGGILNI
ncbi:hypothetical protein BDFB_007388, partial [Asbolus verrucosus]